MERKTTILTITGSDSTGGSGIQADIKTITMLGAYAATAITSVTAQDSEGIRQLYDIPAEVLNLQICAVLNDLKPNAVKIGMLRNVEQVIAVEHLLRKYKPEFVVLDAVIISSSGKMLMPNEVVNAVVQRLFPLSSIVIMQQNSAAYMLHEKRNTQQRGFGTIGTKNFAIRKCGCCVARRHCYQSIVYRCVGRKKQNSTLLYSTWLYRPYYSRFGRSIYIGSCC